MTHDPLVQAARTYLSARDGEDEAKRVLAEARQRRSEAAERVAAARGPLADAIVKAAREGVRQREILTRIQNAYTRERVRQICRTAGVEPDE
jgi:hypothetical protein